MTHESWFSALVPLILLVWREYQHVKKEAQLLDRLMSRDFQQYKIHTRPLAKRNPGNIRPRTDSELALIEAEQMAGQAAIQADIEKKLAEAANHKNKAGTV